MNSQIIYASILLLTTFAFSARANKDNVSAAPHIPEADARRLRDTWSAQRSIIQTARISGSYGLWGMQTFSRKETESFLRKLLPLLEKDPADKSVVKFFQNE